ncbi:MAG: uroporphyrinogen-III synthase [Aquificaceae bacterium]
MALKIALTRSIEDIKKDKELFEKAGFEVIEVPLIEEEVLSFEVSPLSFDFVVFQSPRAVRIFLSRYRLKDEKVVVVGEKTKRAVEEFGYEVWAMPRDYYAEEVVKLFEGLSGKVLIPRSAVGRDEVIEGLKALGLDVYPIDVYRVKERLYEKGDLLKRLREADVILFASPSAVKGLVANLPKEEASRLLKDKKILSIGKTTKEFIKKELGLESQMPEKPTMEHVVEFLKKWHKVC